MYEEFERESLEEGEDEETPKRELFSFEILQGESWEKFPVEESLPLDGFFDWAHNCLPWKSL